MITHCTREAMADIIRMRDKGLTAQNIAGRQDINYTTLRRYIRVYDRYGVEAFVPNQ
jgi:response regulator of citrate/malate metabolism